MVAFTRAEGRYQISLELRERALIIEKDLNRMRLVPMRPETREVLKEKIEELKRAADSWVLPPGVKSIRKKEGGK